MIEKHVQQWVIRQARELGFDPACLRVQEADILLLFARYQPFFGQCERIPVSAYYPISHAAYQAVKVLIERLHAQGIPAEHLLEAPLKELSLVSGGTRLKNDLYAHPQLGSFVHIQAVLLGGRLPQVSVSSEKQDPACRDCLRCTHACRTGAIDSSGFHAERCLRYYMGKSQIPEAYFPYVYELFGCERCQTVCPKNHRQAEKPLCFDAEEILSGRAIKELKTLVGGNTARYRRVIAQTILIAANQKNPSLSEWIKVHALEAEFPRECAYAKKCLRD